MNSMVFSVHYYIHAEEHRTWHMAAIIYTYLKKHINVDILVFACPEFFICKYSFKDESILCTF
jgi:hypothetical protein